MTHSRNLKGTLGLIAMCAVLGMGLLACGGDEPVAAPPPAPPPFQSQPVEVALGESGTAITLMTTEGGGFTLDGEAFESGGTVTAENGNEYALTLTDGSWAAAYVPVESMVELGESGGTVTLARAEDGTYRTGAGEAFESGGTVTAENGNEYALTLTDGSWAAAYVPVESMVELGESGGTVTLARAEDGTYRTGAGEAFESGGTVTAENGNEYALTLTDGSWAAAYVPVESMVELGESGGTVTLARAEDGTYRTGAGEAFESGGTVTAENGNEYALTLTDGSWAAAYVPVESMVELGESGGTVTLARAEDGTYRTGAGEAFESGGTVTAENGNEYALTLTDGSWAAAYVPVESMVELGELGGTVTLARAEDGTYWIGETAVSSGDEHVGANGMTYRLSMNDPATGGGGVVGDVRAAHDGGGAGHER